MENGCSLPSPMAVILWSRMPKEVFFLKNALINQTLFSYFSSEEHAIIVFH